MPPAAILTITTAACLPGAEALLDALRRWHPDLPRFCLLADPPHVLPAGLPATELPLDQAAMPMDNMRLWYDAEEYAAALKPAAIAALFAAGHRSVLCLDPGMLPLCRLDAVFAALAGHPMVLLPLLAAPAGAATELAVRAGGLFSGGCIGITDAPQTRAWLDWWQARLLAGCRADPGAPWAAPGQPWLDFAPSFVPGLHLLRDPAFGVCAANVAARAPRHTDGGWMIGDAPLALLDRRGCEAAGAAHASLFALCPPPLPPAGPAGFGQLADGRVPTAAAREALHAAIVAGRLDPLVPIPPTAPEFDLCDDAPAAVPPSRFDPDDPPPWPAVSELVAACAASAIGGWLGSCFPVDLPDCPPAGLAIDMQSALLWERRSDLRRHYPLRDAASLHAYLGWSLTRGVLEEGIDPTLFGLAWLDLLSGVSAGASADAPPACLALAVTRRAPRPPDLLTGWADAGETELADLAHALWFGWVAPALYGWPERLAANVRRWLADADGTVPLPRGLHILWRLRPDLRAAHDIATSAGRAGLADWAARHLPAEYPAAPALAPAAPAPPRARQPTRRVRLLLTGQWSQPNGRGEDVRATVAALAAVGMTDLVIVDRDLALLRAADGSELPPGPVQAAANIVHCNADTAFEDALLLRRLGVSAGHVIGSWAWELEWLPRWWRHAFGFYDEIWAASRFAYDAFAAERLRPVRLMRPAVCPPVAIIGFERARMGIPPDATLFLASFDYRSFAARKNPDAVIAAFRAAFPRGDEPACLLLKTQSAAHDQNAVRRLVRAAQGDPRIRLWDQVLSAAEFAGLLAAADVYVSLHRSEGFGRGPAEALAAGLAVIATDYSGTSDFLDADNAVLVPARPVRVAPSEYVGVDGQSWAEPDGAAAAAAMAALLKVPPRRPRPVNGLEEVGRELMEYLKNL